MDTFFPFFFPDVCEDFALRWIAACSSSSHPVASNQSGPWIYRKIWICVTRSSWKRCENWSQRVCTVWHIRALIQSHSQSTAFLLSPSIIGMSWILPACLLNLRFVPCCRFVCKCFFRSHVYMWKLQYLFVCDDWWNESFIFSSFSDSLSIWLRSLLDYPCRNRDCLVEICPYDDEFQQ